MPETSSAFICVCDMLRISSAIQPVRFNEARFSLSDMSMFTSSTQPETSRASIPVPLSVNVSSVEQPETLTAFKDSHSDTSSTIRALQPLAIISESFSHSATSSHTSREFPTLSAVMLGQFVNDSSDKFGNVANIPLMLVISLLTNSMRVTSCICSAVSGNVSMLNASELAMLPITTVIPASTSSAKSEAMKVFMKDPLRNMPSALM